MKQLELALQDVGMPPTPLELTPTLRERLVTLMADALLAVVGEVPKRQEAQERTDDDLEL